MGLRRLRVLIVVLVLAVASTSVSAYTILDAFEEQHILYRKLATIHFDMHMTVFEYWDGLIATTTARREAERHMEEINDLIAEVQDLMERTTDAKPLDESMAARYFEQLANLSGIHLLSSSRFMLNNAYEFYRMTQTPRTSTEFELRRTIVNYGLENMYLNLEFRSLVYVLASLQLEHVEIEQFREEFSDLLLK